MKKKSTQRIAAWLLAAGMMAGTFAQPMAVYAESTASFTASDAASDTTAGDTITADADVVIATPAPDADTITTPDTPEPQDPASTAAPTATPAPANSGTADGNDADDTDNTGATPAPTPTAEAPADDTADTDDTTVTPADLQSCMALLAGAELALDTDSIDPEVRDETLALSDEITQTSPTTLQAVVNAAVYKAQGETDITVDVPTGNYTGTLVIPDASIIGTGENGQNFTINYSGKNIILNMNGSTLTVPTDAAVGVSVFGTLTIQGGTIQAAEGCTATRGVQVQLGSALTLDGATVSGFTYAGPGAGVYVKGTATVNEKGQYDVVLNDNDEPVKNDDGTYQFKKLQRENGGSMDTSFTMRGGAAITNCKSDGNGAALYIHNAALLTLENASFAGNTAGGFGGAVYLGTGVQTTIGAGVTFAGNHAAKDGGALYLANQYTLHVKDTTTLVQVPVTFNGGTFTDNSTDAYGGALAFDPVFDGLADNTIQNVIFGTAETTASDDENAEKQTTLHGNYAALRGGAIAFNSYIKENTLKNCTFTGNTALRYAGAVYYPNNYGKTTIFNPVYTVDGCEFTQNSATYDGKNDNDAAGGAILIQVNPTDAPNTVQVASLYVKNSTFTGNTATGYGGAISTRRETGYGHAHVYLNIDGSTFDSNSTTSAAYGGWRGGGAVWIAGYAWADFTANTFTENYSARYGGAIASNNDVDYRGRTITLGALREDGTPDPDKTNTFTNNSAYSSGGAVCIGANGIGDNTAGIYTTVRIYGGSFTDNKTLWGSGGALYVDSGTQRDDLGLEVVGTEFTGNQAVNSSSSGAIRVYGIPTSFKNCTFTNNSTEQSHGGAIWVNRTKRFDLDNVTFTGNTAGAERNDGWGGAIFINDIPSSFAATFNWNNVTFDGNTSRSNGGAVGINTNVYVNLTATGITARNNKGNNGGAFYLSQGRITLTDAVFENNTSSQSGGAVYMWNRYSGNSLTINGSSRFVGNTATNSGGAILFDSNNISYTDDNGKLQFCHGELNILGTAKTPILFSGNTAKNYSGGALCVGSSNTVALDYLDVRDNTAKQYGGGIYINEGSTEGTLTHSKICNNTTAQTGGGVFVYAYFDYQNVKVNDDNVPTRIGESGNFTIENCEVTGNATTGTDGNSRGGGGIAFGADLRNSKFYADDSGTLNIINTTVENNTSATTAGGVYGSYNTTLNISGGSISNNTAATNGGGVVVRNNTTTIKDGTVIEGNTAGTNGGALYTWDTRNDNEKKYGVHAPVLITEDCKISNNTAKKGGIAYITAQASFAMGEKTFPDSNEGVGDVFVEKSAAEVTLPAAGDLQGVYDAWQMDGDNENLLTGPVTNDPAAEHYYTLQGAARYVARLNGSAIFNWGAENFTTLQAALDAAAKKTGDASIDLLADVGEQVTATTVNNPITLNLNGYTLTGKITLNNGQNTNAFTLTDAQADNYKEGSAGGVFTGPANGIEMSNGKSATIRNTLVLTGETLTLKNLSRVVNGNAYIDVTAKDVTFTGNTSGNIWLEGGYNNIQVDGAVSTKNTGFSIYINGGYSNVTLTNAKIYENSGTYGGRVYLNHHDTLIVDGGKYHDNTTTQSGGVLATGGQYNNIIINSGEFYNNKAANGGAVYQAQLGTTTINGGNFYNNTATNNGGVVVASNANSGNHITTLTIAGGEFYNNTAANGGAVYMSTGTGLGTFTMTGGEIYENTANNGGAVYIATKAAVTLSAAEGAEAGGIIRDNTASQLASNLYLGGADTTLTVGANALLYGGTVAGDVLFAQGGTVDLADTTTLYTKDIEDATNLVWLKNDAETGAKTVQETAPAQTIYTLAPAGQNTGSYAARIKDEKFFSINQAIKAMEAAEAEDADANTTTIHLLRNQTEDVTINNTKHSPTLNLNGYTLTGKISVSNLNSVGLTFTLCGDTTQPDSNTEEGGNVFTGKGSGLAVSSQTNNADTKDHVTVKLQDVTLDGFGGNAVVFSSWGKLVAQNVTFSNNRCTGTQGRGAAIGFSSAGTLVADNCKFTNNSIVNGNGCAIYMDNAAGRVTLTNCEFTNNKAPGAGGALALRAHAITLQGNRFAGNSSSNVGGAGYLIPSANDEKAETEAYGSYDAVLENNIFENNMATNQGGALYITPSAIGVTTLLDRCTFTNNSSTNSNGGAVYNNQGTLTLGTGVVFKENKSYGGGSAMLAYGNLLSVRDIEGVTLPENDYDTQFLNNTAGYGNYGGGWAALYVSGGGNKHMRNMLFDGNVAAYSNTASAICIDSASAATTLRDMLIDHCRLVNNVANRYTVYVGTNYANNNLLKINDTVFDNNTVKYGSTDSEAAVLYVSYGNSVEMSNSSITNTQGQGRVLRHYGGGTLDADGNAVPATSTFNNVTIADNKNCYYTPVILTNANNADSDEWKTRSIQAQSTLTDCTITGNAAKVSSPENAGGLAIYKQNVTLDHCTISSNSGGNGGVYVSSPSTSLGFGNQQEGVATFNNCDITGNQGTWPRGAGGISIGFYQPAKGVVNLNGCTITNNTGNYGGGIRVGGNDNDDWNTSGLATLYATNCKISGNTASVKGGGIFASTYDTADGESRLHLTNCEIINNTANYGGGIYVARQVKPENRNKDSQYRDYYVACAASTQTMIVTGGTIADNTAQTYGGGISTDVGYKNANYNTLIVTVADGTVENNRAKLGQDVYAYKTVADTVLHLPQASKIHDNGRWLNENTSETLKDEPIDYDPIQRTYPLTLSVPKVEDAVAQIVENDEVVGGPYDSLQTAMDTAREWLAADSTRSLTVQLLKDTNSSTQVSQGTNVTLDLAGHSIKGIGGQPALTIESSVAIIGGGTISGTATDGGALLLRNNANVTMTDTTIANSRAAYRGGAVCIDNGSSFTLGKGSSITGCQAGRGGAVYVIDGSFTQTDDAVITDCSAFENAAFTSCGYGGAVYVAKGTYTLQSGTVTNNSAPQNGIIYIANNNGAEFTMLGGEVSSNTSRTGAIYQNGGTVTLTGGSITNNTGTVDGGGVYQNGGTSLVRGVAITGNTAPNGAGWYMNGGTCLMRDGTITGNKATKRGGAVFQNGGTMTVNGASITANNAPEGGGLCHNNGKFNFQGGALYANISTNDGTGNDVYSTGKNGVIDLIAAAAMDNDKYNVWRDDYYPYTFTKGYNNTADKIASEGGEPGGKYLTSTVPNVNNVKLTADYYENSSIEIESNDMYIEKMEILTQDSGNGTGDVYDEEDGLITAQDVLDGTAEKPDNVKSVTESTETYPLDYVKADNETTTTANYLTVHYTDGTSEQVRPNTPLDWTAGNDKNEKNALIRSFSTANYIVEMQTKSAEMGEKLVGANERLWMRIKVPCKSGEIAMNGSGQVFNSCYSYYDPQGKCQILEGYKDHIITESEAGGTITMTMQFSITVGGMQNGDRVKPILEAWFDNSSYNDYKTDTNEPANEIELRADPMTVSAQAAYNLAVDNHKTLRHVGYFDMENKEEITESQYKERKAQNKDVVYGMVTGYGLSLQLRNQNASKGLRGIAVPSGDISFNVALHGGLYFNGKRVNNVNTGEAVSINPRLWAYKPNSSETTTGYDTRDNTAGVNMDWGDEDDDDRKSYYDSSIDFNVTDTHSGGTWTVTSSKEDGSYTREDGTEVSQSELNFLVHGYTMKPVGKSGTAYQFSCGYLQVIIPLDMEKYDFAQNGNYEGFLQSDMHVVAGNMEMAGLTGAEMHGKDATLEDKINGYFSYTSKEKLRGYAKNETYYDDNYNNGATVGMNIAKAGDGEVNDLYKTNYWLGSDGSTVLNDQRNPELGTNVTGVGSQLYMTSSLNYSSVTVTPANDEERFLYDPQVDKQAEYYYLTAYDVLMKFDPDAMRPATYEVDGEEKPIQNFTQDQVTTELKGITLLNLSDKGYSEWDTTHKLTQNYNLTVLYAAKANETPIGNENEGNGWTYAGWSKDGAALDESQPLWNHEANTRDDGGTADMDNYGFNTTTRGNGEATKAITGLVYYDTLTELEAQGHTCVAVLYQIRNCCVRNGRSVTLGHMMKVSTDTSKIGRSYAFTTDVRGWTTYRPFFRDKLVNGSDAGWIRFVDADGNTLARRSDLLYQDLIQGNGEQAGAPQDHWLTSKKYGTKQWNIGQVNVQRPGLGNYYQKTQYSNGYEVGGSHSGYTGGNTVLIATQNASVDITTADYSSGNIRQTDYQLDEGQRTVTVQVTPKITMQSNVKKDLEVFDGLTQTDISLDVTLPEDLTLQEGTLTFDYSHSSYNRSDLTWTAQYQYWDEEHHEWVDFNFEQNYAQNYEKRTTRLHLTTTITDVQKTLPVLSFKAGIGYPADPAKDITGKGDDDGNAWYKNLVINAEIHSTYEEEGVNASLGRTDSTEIKVIKNTRTVINKAAATNLVEIGNDLAYDLTYVHQNGTMNLELCDVLPYNSKEFHGAYALKEITVTVEQNEDITAPWDHANLTVGYADTKSVVRSNEGVLKRADTLAKAANGTKLTSANCDVTTDGNRTTYTLKQMPIHTANGDSKLGSLYLMFNNLPECTVTVHVVLAVAQEQDGTNTLLTDADKTTTQQSGDIYSNSYFACTGGANGTFVTSPTASIKVRSRSISGLVWMDQNHDGIYTTKLDGTGKKNVGSDKMLAGVVVTLVQTELNTKDEDPVYTDDTGKNYYAVTDTLGNPVQPVTTKADGHYTFENLEQGNYRVLFTDSTDGYKMEDGSKPVLPFGKLSVTRRDNKKDTANKAAPKYDTDDSTLLAAVSDYITLSDAVLTGRDDKTNINAGFYYTELRLAKVWQNIPDAKKAAEAKVDFTLTAAQGENVLEEAVYTLSNTTVSIPAKADENAEALALFGEFVGDKVKVTDDSTAERTVRWQTEEGLPLQAENANGPIEYTLQQDTVRADKSTWIGNVSFVQQQTTEKVSSGAASDNSVIATRFVAVNTARTYEVLIHKLSDVENKELESAEFTATLQPASLLDKLLGGKVEIKSQQTIQRTGENGETQEVRYRLADLTAGTYILAETKAPPGYAKDPVKYKLTITDRDENGSHILPILMLEDDKGKLLYTAVMTQDEETGGYLVTVTKDDKRTDSSASAVVTDGRSLETINTAQTEQEQSNLPIRTQISMEITDSYLFSLPFTGGSGMNRSLLQGVAVMALAAAAFAVTAVHRKKKDRS